MHAVERTELLHRLLIEHYRAGSEARAGCEPIEEVGAVPPHPAVPSLIEVLVCRMRIDHQLDGAALRAIDAHARGVATASSAGDSGGPGQVAGSSPRRASPT